MNTKNIPAKYRQVYRRAMAGNSRQAAVRAFCLMCVGWQESEVPLCTAPDCPLYPYRSGQMTAQESTQPDETASESVRNEIGLRAVV